MKHQLYEKLSALGYEGVGSSQGEQNFEICIFMININVFACLEL